MVKLIASGLGNLNKEVVYDGGSVIELYTNSIIAEEIRPIPPLSPEFYNIFYILTNPL
jgi:hypothetical protein